MLKLVELMRWTEALQDSNEFMFEIMGVLECPFIRLRGTVYWKELSIDGRNLIGFV